MNIADILLGRADSLRTEIDRQREIKAGAEQKIERADREILALELELVETMAARNILIHTGMRVDRDDAGVPRVTIDQPAVPA